VVLHPFNPSTLYKLTINRIEKQLIKRGYCSRKAGRPRRNKTDHSLLLHFSRDNSSLTCRHIARRQHHTACRHKPKAEAHHRWDEQTGSQYGGIPPPLPTPTPRDRLHRSHDPIKEGKDCRYEESIETGLPEAPRYNHTLLQTSSYGTSPSPKTGTTPQSTEKSSATSASP